MIYALLVLLGLCFGSFINALVWRVRHKRDMLRERSECTHCHHVLEWYDLIPVLSWVSLGGKCRYCRKPIDDHPLVEVLTPILFVVSYAAWPYELVGAGLGLFVIWLAMLVLLIALTVYDLRWYLLPNVMVFPLIALSILFAFIQGTVVDSMSFIDVIVDRSAGVLVIAGLYWALHEMSKGKWIGFGDVKLSIFIGILLGWKGALLCLFLANLVGLVFVLPGLLLGKLSPRSKIPFGPFLIIGAFISFLWGNSIINWYIAGIIGI